MYIFIHPMNIYSLLYGFSRDSRIKKSILPSDFMRYISKTILDFILDSQVLSTGKKSVAAFCTEANLCRTSARAMHSGIYHLPNPLSKSRPIQKSGGFTTGRKVGFVTIASSGFNCDETDFSSRGKEIGRAHV